MPDQPANQPADQPTQDPMAAEAIAKLKEIIAEMETEEGLALFKKGNLKFEIKPDPGTLWYVAYGT